MENIMIEVKDLRKEFRKAVKEPGLKGSFKALFKPEYNTVKAVDGIICNSSYLVKSSPQQTDSLQMKATK